MQIPLCHKLELQKVGQLVTFDMNMLHVFKIVVGLDFEVRLSIHYYCITPFLQCETVALDPETTIYAAQLRSSASLY